MAIKKVRWIGLLLLFLNVVNKHVIPEELHAGISVVSINPLSHGLSAQLGGYGERQGKPAQGTHDDTKAKILTLKRNNHLLVVITLDICHVPWPLVERTLNKTKIEGLHKDNIIMMASHTHAGLEGMSLDVRNTLNNPNIGIYNESILEFVSEQLANGIYESMKELSPVSFSAKRVYIEGMNRNRRQDGGKTDPFLSIIRFDRNNKPWVIFLNFTAHETIMTPSEMFLSAGYPGILQRAVETFFPGVVCMFSNGAEGDVAPAGFTGASNWEKMENYGLALARYVIQEIPNMKPEPVGVFKHTVLWKSLPPHQIAPDFVKIAGDEYKVTEDMALAMAKQLFPSKAQFHLIQINNCAIITFPGEPITEIGLATKQRLQNLGISVPIVTSLTNDLIGYILTEDEYHKSGYEVTASFYGPKLGEFVINTVDELIEQHQKVKD